MGRGKFACLQPVPVAIGCFSRGIPPQMPSVRSWGDLVFVGCSVCDCLHGFYLFRCFMEAFSMEISAQVARHEAAALSLALWSHSSSTRLVPPLASQQYVPQCYVYPVGYGYPFCASWCRWAGATLRNAVDAMATSLSTISPQHHQCWWKVDARNPADGFQDQNGSPPRIASLVSKPWSTRFPTSLKSLKSQVQSRQV